MLRYIYINSPTQYTQFICLLSNYTFVYIIELQAAKMFIGIVSEQSKTSL